MGVKLDTVTARRRIYALGENAFAIVGKYFDTRAVNEHVQLDARVLAPAWQRDVRESLC